MHEVGNESCIWLCKSLMIAGNPLKDSRRWSKELCISAPYIVNFLSIVQGFNRKSNAWGTFALRSPNSGIVDVSVAFRYSSTKR